MLIDLSFFLLSTTTHKWPFLLSLFKHLTSLHLPLLPINNNSTSRKFLVLKTIFVMVLDTSLSLFRPLEMRLNELTSKKEQDRHLYLPTWCNEVTSEIEGHPRRR
ncbi:hypothetical protein Hanom_Chr01g00086341 [Helianthus anomalus]